MRMCVRECERGRETVHASGPPNPENSDWPIGHQEEAETFQANFENLCGIDFVTLLSTSGIG